MMFILILEVIIYTSWYNIGQIYIDIIAPCEIGDLQLLILIPKLYVNLKKSYNTITYMVSHFLETHMPISSLYVKR
jgi:hypothetical protein